MGGEPGGPGAPRFRPQRTRGGPGPGGLPVKVYNMYALELVKTRFLR